VTKDQLAVFDLPDGTGFVVDVPGGAVVSRHGDVPHSERKTSVGITLTPLGV
jgi:hypothetical protein